MLDDNNNFGVNDLYCKIKKERGIVGNRRPPARDGHTGILVFEKYLLVFGGDRHHMPFNDMYLLDLEKEFDD